MQRIINDYYSSGFVRSVAPPPTYRKPAGGKLLPASIVKGSHQRRMTKECLKQTRKALRDKGVLNVNYSDFESLYKSVRDAIAGIRGIGNLTLYDISLRLGRYYTPWIVPEDYVYVAQGALEGACKLLGKDVVKKHLQDKVRLPISLFTGLFPNICSTHIEDMLCAYKDSFVLGGANVVPSNVRNLYSSGCGLTKCMKPSSTICRRKKNTIC